MMNNENTINRRTFLKASVAVAGAVPLLAKNKPLGNILPQAEAWPNSTFLGRNCTGGMINLRAEPSADSEQVNSLYEDAVVTWEKEVVGEVPAGLVSARWVKTEGGYVYAAGLQKVQNLPNVPVTSIPDTSLGPGMWAEVTVPYVDLILDNPPARAPWLQESLNPRLYYNQVIWVDQVQTGDDGRQYYRLNERWSYGDIFWADAAGFKPINIEDVSPISEGVPDKRIEVSLLYQTLTCYEGTREVYFCRCSTGAQFNAAGEAVDEWATPVGPHPIYRKMISVHMSGGTSGGGWDTPGIGWTCFFAQDGVAIHSTFWHNNYGVPVSHGCVNVSPEDAKWIFRWTDPIATYDPGDITVGMPGGTTVDILES
jgi:hypothetical protein